jgi:hypothetical protein
MRLDTRDSDLKRSHQASLLAGLIVGKLDQFLTRKLIDGPAKLFWILGEAVNRSGENKREFDLRMRRSGLFSRCPRKSRRHDVVCPLTIMPYYSRLIG